MFILQAALTAALMCTSCNSENVLTAEAAPEIILDNPDGVYDVTVGGELTIAPQYLNDEGATYRWTIDGVEAGNAPTFTHRWMEQGEFYVDITVTTTAGRVTEELRVDVLEAGTPYISFPFAGDEVTIALGTEYVLTPDVANSSAGNVTMTWQVGDQPAFESGTLHFQAEQTGSFDISCTTVNSAGTDTRTFTINVVEHLPYRLSFPQLSYFQPSTTRYTFVGRPVGLRPVMSQLDGTSFVWTVDGSAVGCTSRTFIFTPDKPGEYNISVTVDDKATASVVVICVDASEQSRRRPASASSSPMSNKVYEWVPAPGQFIGETQTGGMTGTENTPEAAASWAQQRLEAQNFVSLGAFGGYIIVGFDHSISAGSSDYDFAILSNALRTSAGNSISNEPGIVSVSQDVNGNGLPDDGWYELRGSETGTASAYADYAVTYVRPAAPKMNVPWSDNRGNSGSVDYMPSFHHQDYYYPAWIEADSYTLSGTCLTARTSQDPVTGFWATGAFGWGYVDNIGSDEIARDNTPNGNLQRTGFRIANAMLPDGTPVELSYIDFIRVQTGVNSKAGWLGELSTEVLGFQDYTMIGK